MLKVSTSLGKGTEKRILGSLLSFNLGDRDVVAPLVGCYPQLTSDITISARLNFIVPFSFSFQKTGSLVIEQQPHQFNTGMVEKISCMSQKHAHAYNASNP